MSRKLIDGKMPYIKFPADWQIRFMQGYRPEIPIYFAIKKDGAENEIGVCIFTNDNLNEEEFEWEIGILAEYSDGTSRLYYENGTSKVPLHNIEKLLQIVEEMLHEEIKGGMWE